MQTASGRDVRELAAIGVVAETSCRFLRPVYVDRERRRPVDIPAELRAALEPVRDESARRFERAGVGDGGEP
jgi:acyl-CoA thioesterase FadM